MPALSDTSHHARVFEQAAKGVWDSEQAAEEWNGNQDQLTEELLAAVVNVVEDLKDAGLSEQEARVAALKTEGMSHKAVAAALEIDERTVGEYVRRARAKKKEAEFLLDMWRVHGIEI